MTAAATTLRKLTEAQEHDYRENGFVLVRGVLDSDKVEAYRARARAFALGRHPPGSEKMVVKEVRVAKGLVKTDDPEKGIWKYMEPGSL